MDMLGGPARYDSNLKTLLSAATEYLVTLRVRPDMPFMRSGRDRSTSQPESFHQYSCCGSCEGPFGVPAGRQEAALRDVGCRLEAATGQFVVQRARVRCVFAHVASHGGDISTFDDMFPT